METGIKFENYADLVEMLNGLLPALRKKVVMDGLQEAAGVILNQAKSNLRASSKGKSVSGTLNKGQIWRAESLKARNDEEMGGVKIGITKDGYKARFLQWGTRKRKFLSTNKQINTAGWKEKHGGYYHNTGSIIGNDFFYGAVKAKQRDAYNIIIDAILESLERNLSKYKK